MTPLPSNKLQEAFSSRLTGSQQKAVFHLDGPLLVIAGPGSGKTRVITFRIAALIDSGVPPYNICAITFTNKAADEMRQRAVALGASGGAHISTFHSLCVRILRRYAAFAGVNPNFSIYDDSDQLKCIKQAIADCGFDTANFPPARMLDAISTLKNKLIDDDTFKHQADDFFSKTLSKIYLRYQQILKDLNALDFDDLLMDAAFLLEKHSEVRADLGNRFKFLLIDEYQDTNHAQYRIAKALASAHNNICATGDPDQSIYRWRGADIRNILDFERDWPNTLVVRLEENFRSTPGILEVADRLIAHNHSRKEKRLIVTMPSAGRVAIEQYEDEAAEALGIAENIEKLVAEGVTLGKIAVFYRVNAQSRALEEVFIRSKIPYQIVRGVEFYNRKEIRDVLAYLKVFVNPADRVALLRIINTPARGIGKTTIDKLQNFAARRNIGLYEALKHISNILSISKTTAAKLIAFLTMIEGFKKQVPLDIGDSPDIKSKIENRKFSVASLAELVFSESGLEQSLAAEGAEGKDAIANIESLISAAARYDQETENPSLVDYLQRISLFSDVDAYDTSAERVALMTLHSAKGLEFDNVFIVGVEDGLLPHERSVDFDDETEEERRLFFVGITRAKTNLCITFAKYRQIRGQLLRTVPSQFLFELGLSFSESTRSVVPESCFLGPEQGTHFQSEKESFVSSCLGGEKNYKSSIINHKLSPRFHRGDIVVHKKFGIGTVKDFADMGENSVVTVAFNTGQTKSLHLKFAKLVKI
ncbi:MAG: UvrD-helicase domain-containing protein [Sedimentisphaerales bacterium]|nr:UvrD-helicase domain-containing protein [Sedimentisphaerales bacterium]